MSKCKFTRPAFLMRVLTGELTEEELEKVFPHNYPKMYCVYNILRKENITSDDIMNATIYKEDGTIVLLMMTKSLAKQLVSYDGLQIALGKYRYQIRIQVKDLFVTFMISEESDDSDDDCFE